MIKREKKPKHNLWAWACNIAKKAVEHTVITLDVLTGQASSLNPNIDKELENIKVARSLGTQKLALYTKGIQGDGAIIQRIKANLDWIEAELNRMAHLLSKQRPNSWRKHFARAIEVVLQ